MVSHPDKLMYLYFNENISPNELSIATKMLTSLINLRDKILTDGVNIEHVQ